MSDADRARRVTIMQCRDLLLRRAARSRVLELSCETLYVTMVGTRIDGTTDDRLAHIREESRRARVLRLRDAAWLSRADLQHALTPLLAEFRARGGAIEYA